MIFTFSSRRTPLITIRTAEKESRNGFRLLHASLNPGDLEKEEESGEEFRKIGTHDIYRWKKCHLSVLYMISVRERSADMYAETETRLVAGDRNSLLNLSYRRAADY